MKFISLSTKITISAIAIILFFGTIACFVIYQQLFTKMMAREKAALLQVSKTHISDTILTLQHGQEIAHQIAVDPKVIAYVGNHVSVQEPAVLAELNLYNIGQNFSALYIMDSFGNTLVSTDPTFVGNNYAFRDYFIKSMAGELYVDVMVGVTSEELGYYFSSPIRQEGKIMGVAVAKMKPEVVHNTVKSLKNPTNEKIDIGVMLVDRFGVVLYSDETNKTFHSLGKLNMFDGNDPEFKRRYGDRILNSLDYEIVQKSLPVIQKVTLYNLKDEIDGDEEILVVNPLSKFPLYLILEAKVKPLISEIYAISFTLASFVGSAALCALVLISLIVNRMLSPLNEMQRVALEITKGNTKSRVMVNSTDELGMLAKALNTMMDKLMQATESIEKKVNDRTQELQRLNNAMTGRELKMIELKKEIEALKAKITSNMS